MYDVTIHMELTKHNLQPGLQGFAGDSRGVPEEEYKIEVEADYDEHGIDIIYIEIPGHGDFDDESFKAKFGESQYQTLYGLVLDEVVEQQQAEYERDQEARADAYYARREAQDEHDPYL